jgi:hypothetical protein
MALDNQFSISDKPKEASEEKVDHQVSEVFKTPEETAARDDHSTATPVLDKSSQEYNDEQKSKKKRRIRLSWPPTKKQWIVIAIVLVVVLAAGFLLFKHFHKPVVHHELKHIKISQIVAPKPTTVASDLSGLQVNPSLNNLPVTAVMVENSLDARPQSGLSQAGVVFEAVAEGGVTRFMALYQDTSPSNVGPIRSARPYYISWALGFDAGYAHVGGSPDALADIKSWNVRDLDEFYNGSSYHRISTRAAPHNVYTGIATLNQLEDTKGYTSSQYTSWTRKADSPLKTPTAGTINLSLSGVDYNPTYNYDAGTNSYNRSESGAPQMDANTNTQISPKVVIAIVVPESQGALDSSGAYYSDYNVIGSGTAYIFQDGGLTSGQWTKSSNTSQILFTTSAGKNIPLNAGQVWISAVTSTSAVTHSP